mmetsp:Transcript_654/g.714  ORF Transcript_654/g.714 Transcript_654/m.714 type:complete len:111 (+) Transcript_654:615-947(+)
MIIVNTLLRVFPTANTTLVYAKIHHVMMLDNTIADGLRGRVMEYITTTTQWDVTVQRKEEVVKAVRDFIGHGQQLMVGRPTHAIKLLVNGRFVLQSNLQQIPKQQSFTNL